MYTLKFDQMFYWDISFIIFVLLSFGIRMIHLKTSFNIRTDYEIIQLRWFSQFNEGQKVCMPYVCDVANYLNLLHKPPVHYLSPTSPPHPPTDWRPIAFGPGWMWVYFGLASVRFRFALVKGYGSVQFGLLCFALLPFHLLTSRLTKFFRNFHITQRGGWVCR